MADVREIACKRSRAKAEIHSYGGRVTGYAHNRRLPVVYAIAPCGGDMWPVRELTEVVEGARYAVRTSVIQGCTVIWGDYEANTERALHEFY